VSVRCVSWKRKRRGHSSIVSGRLRSSCGKPCIDRTYEQVIFRALPNREGLTRTVRMARVGPFVPLHAQARERLILPVYVRRAPCATLLLPSDLSQLPHSRLVDGAARRIRTRRRRGYPRHRSRSRDRQGAMQGIEPAELTDMTLVCLFVCSTVARYRADCSPLRHSSS
jgi:hypothetical protein